jgi:hypothetical protein
MVLLTPTSIAYTGTSATVGTNGSVEFTACTALRLNGVFSADYDNYMIVMREKNASGTNQILYRYASGGSDTATTTYTAQELYADSTSVTGYRGTSQTSLLSVVGYTTEGGFILNVYGPYLAQPTASRGVSCDTRGGALITDVAGTQSGSTSFDGINFFVNASTISGLVSVYGLVGA